MSVTTEVRSRLLTGRGYSQGGNPCSAKVPPRKLDYVTNSLGLHDFAKPPLSVKFTMPLLSLLFKVYWLY